MHTLATKKSAVPASDGAGTVEEVGSGVSRFKKGDKVVTLFNQADIAGPLTSEIGKTGLGGMIDGTFCQYGKFDEQGQVAMPSTLTFQQANTLSCAALTA